ncbi:hypothetical protein [Bryocella elongata]|uniref:hypothetical protein n=1 Tax=Bryocella elongata TaxID=863522 RepID=UPI0013578697|nr:hypothetical protein [Bryocella elongata]
MAVAIVGLGLAISCAAQSQGRFDLVGPKIDVRVSRGAQTLPIAAVPNLQPGDRIWLHPDFPPTQSVKYLLICVFLRGTTNPPPDTWFTRIETWDKHVRQEGVMVTVPEDAQQVVLFMAPETGGDFSTLKSAVQGRPGAFVRASQDLTEAGFEQARIEKYMASIRLVPPSDPMDLQKHSDLLARTLALKPNESCFKQPVDMQFTCLTQTGSQIVLDDGHGQTVINALSNGAGSDLINQASYTQAAGGGLYSAYVGAIVDMVRILSNLHTAQYQYIPAIAFPQEASMNLRLNTPPSFHNPKSVLIIALPSVQKAQAPPLRTADARHVACLLAPTVVLPIEGAPLVFSTAFGHDIVLHLNTPPGAPAEPDIRLLPDAYQGGLVLQLGAQHHVPLRDQRPLTEAEKAAATASVVPGAAPVPPQPKPIPPPIHLTGTIQGRWGFDSFTGPTVELQQLPGTGWALTTPPSDPLSPDAPRADDLIAGHAAELMLTSTGSACVHAVTAQPAGSTAEMALTFQLEPHLDQPNLLAVKLPSGRAMLPGDLHLEIQQYGQPRTDSVAARAFAEPAHIAGVQLYAGDRSITVAGARLEQVEKVRVGDLIFAPVPVDPGATAAPLSGTLRLTLPDNAPRPPTHASDHLMARIQLRDGRELSSPIVVAAPRPSVTLLSKTAEAGPEPTIKLGNPDDLPLSSMLTFTLKSTTAFPRNGQVEVETTDGTLRTVLTLAPAGGLLLQDPHTVVASLDPLRSFGPSAFGALRVREVFPVAPGSSPSEKPTAAEAGHPEAAPSLASAGTGEAVSPASDWQQLVTLVRLPALGQLQCAIDVTQPCTLSGTNLFLVSAISTDPALANPVSVPDGYTANTLTVPHPASSGTLFLRLRDDPTAVDSALLPLALPSPPPPRGRSAAHAAVQHAGTGTEHPN